MKYYLLLDGEKQGPFDLEELASRVRFGGLDPLVQVTPQDRVAWQPLERLLATSATTDPAGPPVPPPLPSVEAPGQAPETRDLFALLGHVFFHFTAFAKKHLRRSLPRPPFWFMVIWLSGIAGILDRFEMRALRQGFYGIDNWALLWAMALIVGPVFGIIGYGVRGFLYHIGVRLAGGRGSMQSSLYLNLYAGLPLILPVIFFSVLQTVYHGSDYFLSLDRPVYDVVSILGTLVAAIYSITLGYKGAKHVQGVKPVRGVLFFVFIPLLLYSAIFFGFGYVLDARGDKADTHNAAGIALAVGEQHDLAIGQYKRALALSRMDPALCVTILQNLANSYESLGKVDEALAQYDEALAIADPASLEYHLLRANRMLLLNKTREALELFVSVLDADPQNFKALNALVLIYLGDYDEGYADYEQALDCAQRFDRLQPSPVSRLLLGKTHYMLEHYAEAMTLFEGLLEERPDDGACLLFAGASCYFLEDAEKGLRYLNKAVALDPSVRTEFVQTMIDDMSREAP